VRGRVAGGLKASHGDTDDAAGPGAAVHLGVLGQVVAAGKLLVAERTLVRLDARVRAAVARKFIRAGEPVERDREGQRGTGDHMRGLRRFG